MSPTHPPSSPSESAFDCPFCDAYANQVGFTVHITQVGRAYREMVEWAATECARCGQVAMWHHSTLMWPAGIRPGTPPLPEMPEDVQAVYEEARQVAAVSPRAGVALLRLALQMLVDDLVTGTANIYDKIGDLVKRGLDPNVQKAMDVLRFYGNNAVHPGQIEVDSEPNTLPALFALLNLIVEHVIVRAQSVQALYETLPERQREAIAKRDGGQGI